MTATLAVVTKLADLGIPPVLLTELHARSFVDATPVQASVVKDGADGDLVVSSQTGSGKTVAYGLTLASALLVGDRAKRASHPRAVVVAPTRELALQVARELTWLYRGTGARIATSVGGMDPRRESQNLRAGAEIVVGTPGRLCDHIERKTLHLDQLAVVVLDEADEMLDMGFREELEKILDKAPKERRTLMFSATFPREMEALAKKFTRDPKRIQASAPTAAHADIDYIAHAVAPREREHAVVNVLRFHDAPSALVFCATRDGVFHLHASLVERGFGAVALSGELSQSERNRAVSAIREERARVLVATDVAARGLDLPAVGLVIHGDLPNDASVLQHRSGRTGRAGKKGTAVILVPFPRRRAVERMLREAHVAARFLPVPTAKEVRSLDDQRLIHEVRALAAEPDVDDLAVARALVEQMSAEAIAGVLVRSLKKTLPSPEDLHETSSPRAQREERQNVARGRASDGVWFKVNVGREQRADPKWLLPMLCRRGHVTKRDLGAFDIHRRETRFEVSPAMAKKFAESAARPDTKDPHIKIEPE